MTESTPTPHDRDERDADRAERDADRDGDEFAAAHRDADRNAERDEFADALSLTIDGLRYTLDRPPRRGGGKVVVSVQLESGGDTPLRDRVDLYGFKERLRFAGLVADLFARQRRCAIGHLALLLDQIERARGAEPVGCAPVLDAGRAAAAKELLGKPDVLDRAAEVMDRLGYVGEERIKRLAYLVATSRLLPRPLSAILMAPSGCGKSELLEVTAKLLPPEHVEFLSRISQAALYYAGPDALRHKLILVDEATDSAEADHSIRTLQSKGLLRLLVPLKGKSEPFTVYGPISLMSGTTSSDLNPENLSRCLELSLDGSPEQTRRIQEAQRRAWAGEAGAAPDAGVWQDAQRLLEPLTVRIPFAQRLTFPARTAHDRRGNTKLLGLVASHALLCQRQRERDAQGRVVAVSEDYRVVHALLGPAVAREVDGLSPRAALAYRTLLAAPTNPLTRRALAAKCGWSYMTAKRALDELMAQEVARLLDPTGVPRQFVLVQGESVLGTQAQLTPPGALQ